jgi:hypothetical protein
MRRRQSRRDLRADARARLHPGLQAVRAPAWRTDHRRSKWKRRSYSLTTVGVFGFLYFGMVDTAIPSVVFIAIVLSLIPHDMQYGPQAALIAEAFTPRLRYSGASLGYQLASVIAGGPAPLIATALFAAYQTGYAIAIYIAACAVVSLVAVAFMPDYTGKDISMEYDD